MGFGHQSWSFTGAFLEVEHPVGILHQVLEEGVNPLGVEQHGGLFCGIAQSMRDVLGHLSGVIVEERVMLDENQRMVGLLQDGHELEDGKSPADFQGLKPAVQPGKDGGGVAGDVEHLEPLQVKVAIQGLDEHLPGSRQGIEGPGPEGDRGKKLEVHA